MIASIHLPLCSVFEVIQSSSRRSLQRPARSAVIGLPDATAVRHGTGPAALLFSGLPWLLRRATFNLAPSEELSYPHSRRLSATNRPCYRRSGFTRRDLHRGLVQLSGRNIGRP